MGAGSRLAQWQGRRGLLVESFVANAWEFYLI